MAAQKFPFTEIAELGRGTSGQVLLVEWSKDPTLGSKQPKPGEKVAVKRLHPDASDEQVQQLRLEIQLGQSLSHPALTRVIAAGVDWFAMPWLSGGRMDTFMQASGPLEGEPLRRAALALAGGLAHLHAAGWLHGDCKPENIALEGDPNGDPIGGGKPRWIDLGFARSTTETASTGRGSPRWLSPEELGGKARTKASEVFSLALILFEMCTGDHPFLPPQNRRSSDLHNLAERMHRRHALRPSALAPTMSPGFEALLEDMLHPIASARPSAAEVVKRLKSQRNTYRQPAGECPFGPVRRIPFTGRESELTRAIAALSAGTARQSASALWLEGIDGAGTSRLADEFARRVRRTAEPAVALQTRPSRVADAAPLQPMLDMLRTWLHASADRPPGLAAIQRLEASVPQASAQVLLAALSGAPQAAGLESHLVDWLHAACEQATLVVLIDNVELLGAGSLAVLERAVSGIGQRRLMLMLVRVPERRPQDPVAFARLEARLERTLSISSIELSPLELSEVTDLVGKIFARDAPRKRIARALHQRSEGQPALLAELLQSLEQSRAIVTQGEALTIRVPPEDWPAPESLARLLDERFRELRLELRLWLQRCAVAGQNFTPRFLAQAFGHTTGEELETVLNEHCASGWLRRTGSRYRFTRGALRLAALRSISSDRRARLHGRVARALQTSKAPDPFVLAFHLRLAGDKRGLLDWLEQSLAATREQHKAGRVLTLARWGLDALAHQPDLENEDLEAALLEAAADSAGQLGHRAQQRQWLDRLTELDLDAGRRPGLAARVYLLHGRAAVESGMFGMAGGLLRNARLLAEQAGDQRTELEARLEHGRVHIACGALQNAREELDPIIHGGRNDMPLLRALGQLASGLVDLLDNHLEAALAATQLVAQSLSGDARPRAIAALASAHALRSRIERILGHKEEAWSSLRQASELSLRADDRRLEVEIAVRRGRLLLESNQLQEAESELREARWQAGEINDPAGQTTAELFLGVLLAEQESREGFELLRRVHRELGRLGLKRLQALAEALVARVALSAGQLDQAQARAQDALAQLELYGAELQDRIVIEGTAGVVAVAQGNKAKRRQYERQSLVRVRQEVAKVQSPELRKSLRRAAAAALRAAFSDKGSIYPHLGNGRRASK